MEGTPWITLPDGADPHTMFRCSFKDQGGDLWFGTTGAGLYKYDGELFTHYGEEQGLTSNFVVGIAGGLDGTIWVATNNGIFHGNGDAFSRLAMPAPGPSQVGNGISTASTGPLQVFCVLGDRKGNVWFGTESDGLWKYDGRELTNYKCADRIWSEASGTATAEFGEQGFISALLEDREGKVWFSSSATGLDHYDDKEFHRSAVDLARTHVLQMMEDGSGMIWLATRVDGVCRYNGRTMDRFAEEDGVADNMASCLYQAANGNIWLGSLGKAGTGGGGRKGITVYDGKTFTHLPSTGMRNDQVWTIIADDAGNMWIGTKEFGLFRYDGRSFTELTRPTKGVL